MAISLTKFDKFYEFHFDAQMQNNWAGGLDKNVASTSNNQCVQQNYVISKLKVSRLLPNSTFVRQLTFRRNRSELQNNLIDHEHKFTKV